MRTWRIWAAAHVLLRRAAVFLAFQRLEHQYHFSNKNQHFIHEQIPKADIASE